MISSIFAYLFIILMFIPGISVLILFYILVSNARLLLEKLDEKITDIIEKSNRADLDKDDNFCVSEELDNWRHQYELVSKWIDRLFSCFGFLILVELATFSLHSFFYFSKMLLTYATVAIHERYGTFAMSAYANEIERLIGRPLLTGFQLGDHHILSLGDMIYLKETSELWRYLPFWIANQTNCWFRLLIILIPTYRMRNQVSLRRLYYPIISYSLQKWEQLNFLVTSNIGGWSL